MSIHEIISNNESEKSTPDHPFENAELLANSFSNRDIPIVASNSVQGFNPEVGQKEGLLPEKENEPELTKAWEGGMDPMEVFSHEDWRNFVKGELESLESQRKEDPDALKFDCADLSLYLMAKYHKDRGVELNYVHPITGEKFSSSDEKYSGDNGFSEFVFGNPESKSADEYSGFLGAFGAQHLYQGGGKVGSDNYPINVNGQALSHPVEDLNETAPGDFGVSMGHTMPVYQVNNATENNVDYDSIYSSGGYYGPGDAKDNGRFGLGENSITIPEKSEDVNVNAEDDYYRMMTFNFLNGVPKRYPIPKLESMPPSPILSPANNPELIRNLNPMGSSAENAVESNANLQSGQSKEWKGKLGVQGNVRFDKSKEDYKNSPSSGYKANASAIKSLTNGNELALKGSVERRNQYKQVNGLSGDVKGMDYTKLKTQVNYSQMLGNKTDLSLGAHLSLINKQSVKKEDSILKSETKNSAGVGLNAEIIRKLAKYKNGLEFSGTMGVNYSLDKSLQGPSLKHYFGANLGLTAKNEKWGINASGSVEGGDAKGVNAGFNVGFFRYIGGGKTSKPKPGQKF